MRDQDTAKAGKASSTRTAPARSAAAPATDPTGLLSLQRGIGNAAVVQLLADAGDLHSQEQHEHGPGCSHGEGGAPVQRSSVQSVLSSSGSPLAAPMRAEMESRLGADFSDVRLHTGGAAQRSAAEIGARAYTSGNHVVIGEGGADKHTLAHELTHVIQQRQGPVAGTDNGSGLKVSDPSDRFEREAEANATRALSKPAAAEQASAGPDTGAAGPVQRAAAPAGPAPIASDQIQRAGGTGLLERGKKKLKHGMEMAGPTADVAAGVFSTGGTTVVPDGAPVSMAHGVGAASIIGGALAVPDLVASSLTLCSALHAWNHAVWHGAEGEGWKAFQEVMKATPGVVSNGAAASGGIAGGVGTITTAAAPAMAGGGLGVVTGAITGIQNSIETFHSARQLHRVKHTELPTFDYKKLVGGLQELAGLLDKNHAAEQKSLAAQLVIEDRKVSGLPAEERDIKRAAHRIAFEAWMEESDNHYKQAKTKVDDSIEQYQEAANLKDAKGLAERKGLRRTIRKALTAVAGALGIPVGVCAIIAAALGAGVAASIPVAGWAIAGVVGFITAGVLGWEAFNKFRANKKALENDEDFKHDRRWDIYIEAAKIWKPKAESSRDRAAQTLYDGLKTEYDENRAGAEALVKALKLDPAELLKMADPKAAVAKIKGRLAST